VILRAVMRYPHLLCAGAIAALAGTLYLPFLGNPLVFDDLAVFSGADFAYFAAHPFAPSLRNLPYFSLAFPQVMWGYFPPWDHAHIHRILSLAFHIACALALYKLILDLVRTAGANSGVAALPGNDAIVPAFAVAAVFAIHPVAVYGAGYLVQRTIVLATLFSLLSVMYFARGLARGKRADASVAALFYTLAVFSKEHSVLLPAAAVMAAPLLAQDRRFTMRYAALYLLACLPAAATAVTLTWWVVGAAYEPHIDAPLAWIASAVTQSGLFFRYLAAWVLPDTAAMSIDVRIDFAQGLSPAWMLLKTGAFTAFGALGLMLLFRRGRAGVAGFGMLYFWILFLVEFSTVRFQEPYVLYRSYLWAPGILIALAAVLSALPRKIAFALLVIACPILLYQSHDRLRTFSGNHALWADAAAKLPSTPVPGGWRPLFNLAREQTFAGRVDRAIETVDRCLAQYPGSSRCHFARGALHNRAGEHEQALPYLDRALALRPGYAVAHYQRGLALEKLGRREEAEAAYRESSRLGYFGGYRGPREPE
jgi:protein O-mannosyl-transferase